jgi:hypothetical protein
MTLHFFLYWPECPGCFAVFCTCWVFDQTKNNRIKKRKFQFKANTYTKSCYSFIFLLCHHLKQLIKPIYYLFIYFCVPNPWSPPSKYSLYGEFVSTQLSSLK